MNKSEPKFSARPLFAAANSGKGFVSFYRELFANERIERRYIIKGGPGTGKSSFMKRVAEDAERRGKDVEYYRCSSDASSLDGMIIDGRIAFLDGTAPHSADTELAGARDEIIDLGAFWNSAELTKSRAEIERLSESKGECYRRAYRFLAACDELFEINRSLVLPSVRHEKLEAAVERALGGIGRGDGGRLKVGIADSVGMGGRVRFDSYERSAKRLWVIDDHYKTAHLYLSALICGGLAHSCSLRVSYDPVHIKCPDAVYFCHTGDCFVIAREGEEQEAYARINMKRFVNADGVRGVRAQWRANERMYEAMLSSACESLAEAGKWHFALEELYMRTMDFKAQNAFCDEFLKKYSEFL